MSANARREPEHQICSITNVLHRHGDHARLRAKQDQGLIGSIRRHTSPRYGGFAQAGLCRKARSLAAIRPARLNPTFEEHSWCTGEHRRKSPHLRSCPLPCALVRGAGARDASCGERAFEWTSLTYLPHAKGRRALRCLLVTTLRLGMGRAKSWPIRRWTAALDQSDCWDDQRTRLGSRLGKRGDRLAHDSSPP